VPTHDEIGRQLLAGPATVSNVALDRALLQRTAAEIERLQQHVPLRLQLFRLA
jgi:hypothetical protein